jgi:hypothetical protein
LIGISYQNTAFGAFGSQTRKTFMHPRYADTSSLVFGQHGNGIEAVSISTAIRNRYRRDSDMANYLPINFRDQIGFLIEQNRDSGASLPRVWTLLSGSSRIFWMRSRLIELVEYSQRTVRAHGSISGSQLAGDDIDLGGAAPGQRRKGPACANTPAIKPAPTTLPSAQRGV